LVRDREWIKKSIWLVVGSLVMLTGVTASDIILDVVVHQGPE